MQYAFENTFYAGYAHTDDTRHLGIEFGPLDLASTFPTISSALEFLTKKCKQKQMSYSEMRLVRVAGKPSTETKIQRPVDAPKAEGTVRTTYIIVGACTPVPYKVREGIIRSLHPGEELDGYDTIEFAIAEIQRYGTGWKLTIEAVDHVPGASSLKATVVE